MTTELVSSQQLQVTNEQRSLIKQTLAPDATDVELELFFYDNRRRGVHPLDRLIHFTKRQGRYVPITSIHFMRGKADEGGRAGQDLPIYAGKEGTQDYECAVTVYKMIDGQRVPYIGVAKWKEYYPGNEKEGFMWRKMPSHMLAKTAEANALRLGFPRELAGLHIAEEVHVLDEPTPISPSEPPLTLKEKLKAKVETTEPPAPAETGQQDSLEQPSPLRNVPSIATADTAAQVRGEVTDGPEAEPPKLTKTFNHILLEIDAHPDWNTLKMDWKAEKKLKSLNGLTPHAQRAFVDYMRQRIGKDFPY